MGITDDLVEFIVGTNAEDLPVSAWARAALCALDWFGCALGGAADGLTRTIAEPAFPITQAQVTVTTLDGAELTEAVDLLGEADPAGLRGELGLKFRTLAAPVLGAEGAAHLEAALLDLESAASVASLMELAVVR